jgi:hypothetical protein
MNTEKLGRTTSGYTLYGRILKGKFSEAGKHFNGKIYYFKLPADGFKKEKELRITAPLDITNEAALKPLYFAEGSMSFFNATGFSGGKIEWPHSWGWDGEVKDAPLLVNAFPGAEIHKAMFDKGAIRWIDVSLPVQHRFIRYTGHTFASGDFMFGKAQLDNGDVYEGFFLKNSFHGPGKLTKRSGKILQGIWQIDSLAQKVAVEFPAALLQAELTKPTQLNMSAPTEWNASGLRDFYGEVVNNEASGWGYLKIDNAVPKFAYGYWQHNQLEGAGIYFPTPTARQLSYQAGNKTTWQNDFWITTGVYKNAKIVTGTELVTDYSVYANMEIPETDVQRLSFEKILLSTNPLQGCGMQMEFWYSNGYEARPTVFNLKEGYYIDGKLTGFYFENDKEKKRSYEFLRFLDYHRNWKITEDLVKSAETSSNFCFEAISSFKPLLVAEMRKTLASNIAAEAWEKSPEGQAHKRQVEIANREYEAKLKKECDAEFAKIGVKGRTYVFQGDLVILEGYDCNKHEFIAWRPRQANDIAGKPDMTQVRGLPTFLGDKLSPSVKQYETCAECNGTGKVIVTTSTTRTKELPFGYFSGIETKSIRTTTKDEVKSCSKCKGLAIVLR